MSTATPTKTLIETVHMSVDPEWLTDFVRQLWAENSYQKAIRVLDAAFPTMVVEHKHNIIRGKLKRVNDPKEEGLLMLRKDKWKPNLRMCAYGIYPDPDDLATMASHSLRLKREVMEQEVVIEERNKVILELEEEDELTRESRADAVLQKSREDARGRAYQTIVAMKMREAGVEVDDLPAFAKSMDPVAYCERQRELDTMMCPAPDPTCESKHGWVKPSGQFYPCGHMEHIWLADKLGTTERQAELDGWIKITTSPISGTSILLLNDNKATQRQINTVFDWCQRHKHPLPSWAGGKDD